jgi:deoxyribonuclease-4
VRIGAHVSVAGGLEQAVGNATAVGCEALQVFVSNARGWAPPPVDPAADERFRADLAAAGLGPCSSTPPTWSTSPAPPGTAPTWCWS